MKLIDRFTKKELSEFMGKCWMTHDGMWFYSCVRELGIEKANQLNKAAIGSLAAIEVKRFKKALGIDENKIETFEDLKTFFTSISDILLPDFMNVSFRFPEKNIMQWEFNDRRCFACNGMKLLGVADKYECGPIYRIECWLRSLEINYEITPKINQCISPDDGKCAGTIGLFFDR